MGYNHHIEGTRLLQSLNPALGFLLERENSFNKNIGLDLDRFQRSLINPGETAELPPLARLCYSHVGSCCQMRVQRAKQRYSVDDGIDVLKTICRLCRAVSELHYHIQRWRGRQIGLSDICNTKAGRSNDYIEYCCTRKVNLIVGIIHMLTSTQHRALLTSRLLWYAAHLSPRLSKSFPDFGS